MTLYILAAYRWTMLPDADRGHMLEDSFRSSSGSSDGEDTSVFVAVWSDLIQARGDSHWGVQKLSGGIQPMRKDFHRVDGPAGTRRFQDAAVVEGEAT